MFQSFTSIEEIIATLQEAEQQADAATHDWQRAIPNEPGAFVCALDPAFGMLYAEVVGDANLQPGESPTPPNKLFVNAFSVCEPDGELGFWQRSTIYMRLSEVRFERARVAGWPNSEQDFWERVVANDPKAG